MQPYITVIMPIRNEAEFIYRSLGAILVQDYPAERMEILIADGMSTDGTREIIGSLAIKDPRVRVLDNPARIMATGFNTALSVAKGDVIVVVGGHTELSSNYLSRSVAYLCDHDVDCVGGHMETIASTSVGQTIALAMSSSFGVGGVAFRTQTDLLRLVDTVAFGAYRREIIEQAGPLDEELVRNQDDEYNYRLRKMGAKILQVPDISSRYYSRSSLGALWRQYFQYGFWKVRVLQKHPFQMSPRQFVPPIFVLVLCMSLVSLPLKGGWLPLLLVLGAYLLANLSASLHTSVQHGWRHLPVLSITYAILHFSYGFGFLFGLIKFFRRWNESAIQVRTHREEGRQRFMPPAD